MANIVLNAGSRPRPSTSDPFVTESIPEIKPTLRATGFRQLFSMLASLVTHEPDVPKTQAMREREVRIANNACRFGHSPKHKGPGYIKHLAGA